jgi:hypothetical protein
MSAKAVQRVNRLKIVLAFLFGCFALAAVLWLAFKSASLTEPQFEILRIVLALAGGGICAMIPGFLELNMTTGTKLALRAGGALAVFAVLYFWSPAHWERPSAVTQKTGGINSPAQNGNGNTVINNSAPSR